MKKRYIGCKYEPDGKQMVYKGIDSKRRDGRRTRFLT